MKGLNTPPSRYYGKKISIKTSVKEFISIEVTDVQPVTFLKQIF